MTDETSFNPWVLRFLANRDGQYVTEQHAKRAAKILQLIIDEASIRGLSIADPDEPSGLQSSEYWDWSHVVFGNEEVAYYVQINELCVPGTSLPVPAQAAHETEDDSRPLWLRNKRKTFVGSGNLRIMVKTSGQVYTRNEWRDGKAKRLENRIAEILDSLMHSLALSVQRRKEQEEQDRRRHQAYERYHSLRMLELLDGQASRMEKRDRQRRHLDKLEGLAISHGGENTSFLLETIARVRKELGDFDPVEMLDVLFTNIPEPSYQKLTAYMQKQGPEYSESVLYPNQPRHQIDQWAGSQYDTYAMATGLYDSGSFQFENTSDETEF